MTYHKGYLRQLDFYAYLLKLNKYKVNKKGYWVVQCCPLRAENF